jgi:S1-C subfamily serine protease
MMLSGKQRKSQSLAFLAALVAFASATALGNSLSLSSVVKVYATVQPPNYAMPWQAGRPEGGTGSGFIIAGKRILTNGHVVSDARFIQVQKDGDPRRYTAKVATALVGHDCDLAVLTVPDDTFFDGTRPLDFARSMPSLADEVSAVGYPMGGDRLSVTRGIVSRLDYGTYSHSGVDQHLVLQVDAAINPGNSGGPVFFGRKVVGLAFQGLMGGENIGYAIPLPVIHHYLTDIADGCYHGYPELGVAFMDTDNPALRTHLRIPGSAGGIAVTYIDPFGSARDLLRTRDVLLTIEGSPIASDGTIEADGSRLLFAELLERKQWGESIVLDVWRDGARQKTVVPLTNPPDPFVFRKEYDRKPRFLVVAGLVFTPLTRSYLLTPQNDPNSDNAFRLRYVSHFAKLDKLHEGIDEFVVLTRRLSREVNAYADPFLDGIVTEVNGARIRCLDDVKAALDKPRDGFHVFRFMDSEDMLVLDAATLPEVDRAIRKAYGLDRPERLEEAP